MSSKAVKKQLAALQGVQTQGVAADIKSKRKARRKAKQQLKRKPEAVHDVEEANLRYYQRTAQPSREAHEVFAKVG
jgi:hypothetical protein